MSTASERHQSFVTPCPLTPTHPPSNHSGATRPGQLVRSAHRHTSRTARTPTRTHIPSPQHQHTARKRLLLCTSASTRHASTCAHHPAHTGGPTRQAHTVAPTHLRPTPQAGPQAGPRRCDLRVIERRCSSSSGCSERLEQGGLLVGRERAEEARDRLLDGRKLDLQDGDARGGHKCEARAGRGRGEGRGGEAK